MMHTRETIRELARDTGSCLYNGLGYGLWGITHTSLWAVQSLYTLPTAIRKHPPQGRDGEIDHWPGNPLTIATCLVSILGNGIPFDKGIISNFMNISHHDYLTGVAITNGLSLFYEVYRYGKNKVLKRINPNTKSSERLEDKIHNFFGKLFFKDKDHFEFLNEGS